ncbi:MAG: hypothetical protein Kow0077_29140 [Anaerolineae bacterium]
MSQVMSGPQRWLHWLARIYGSLLAGGWLLLGVLSLFEEPEPYSVEGTFVAIFMIAGAVFTAVAWRDPKLGGRLLTGMAVLFGLFALASAGRHQVFAMLVSGGPFLISGLLFLASARWAASE